MAFHGNNPPGGTAVADAPAADPAPAAIIDEPTLRRRDDGSAVLGSGHSFGTITDKINGIVLAPVKTTPKSWILGFMASFVLVNMLAVSVVWLLMWGVGVWGLNVPVGWAFDITNFVWWIGIGHAGTLISAILLLLRQQWRTSINRFSEAMTLFAVACAGLFPLLHTGRPWLAYWLMPYPSTTGLLPQFLSPLEWDVFAVSTYGTVSLLFWYVGLIPDFGSLRDRTRNRILQVLFGVLSMGWRGSARHWHRYEMAYLLLAGLATPLVVSVHTVVSFDFAISQLPGWHTTVFPPYFVAGAVFSGFAMVLTLAIPTRAVFKLHDFITMRHLNNMAKVMLATGLIVAYGYGIEAWTAFYSGNEYERFMMLNRAEGPYKYAYWALIACNVVIPQLLWFKWVRQNLAMLFVISIVVNVGMWLERFVIIVISLHRDFLPSSWDMFYPTIWDWGIYIGTIGFFLVNMFLFVRFVPMISAFEMRELLSRLTGRHGAGPGGAASTADQINVPNAGPGTGATATGTGVAHS